MDENKRRIYGVPDAKGFGTLFLSITHMGGRRIEKIFSGNFENHVGVLNFYPLYSI